MPNNKSYVIKRCLLSDATRLLRESKGISQGEIAFKMGITQQAYSKMERSILTARLEQILLLGSILGVPLIVCIHQEPHFLNEWYSRFLLEQSSYFDKDVLMKRSRFDFVKSNLDL